MFLNQLFERKLTQEVSPVAPQSVAASPVTEGERIDNPTIQGTNNQAQSAYYPDKKPMSKPYSHTRKYAEQVAKSMIARGWKNVSRMSDYELGTVVGDTLKQFTNNGSTMIQLMNNDKDFLPLVKRNIEHFAREGVAEGSGDEYQELRKLQQQWWVALPAIMKQAGIDYRPVRELSRDYYPTLGWITIPGEGNASFEVNANPKGDAAKINISVDVGTSNEFYRTSQPERAAKLNAFAEKIAQALGGSAAKHMTGERRNHPGVSRVTATMTLPKEPAEWQNPSRGYDPVARFLSQPGERARQSRVARSANPGSFGGDSSNYTRFNEGSLNEFEDFEQRMNGGEQGVAEGAMDEAHAELQDIVANEDYDALYDLFTANTPAGKFVQDIYDDVVIDNRLHPDDDFERIQEIVFERLADEFGQEGVAEGGKPDDEKIGGRYEPDEFDQMVLRLKAKAQEQERKHGPVDLAALARRLNSIADKK